LRPQKKWIIRALTIDEYKLFYIISLWFRIVHIHRYSFVASTSCDLPLWKTTVRTIAIRGFRICLPWACVQNRATAALTGQNAQEEGKWLAGLWEDRDGMRYINLCFPVILISSTHEVRDNIVTCRKHFPHLPCWEAIKISASQYNVTAASILSNPQTIRPRECSCLCRKVQRFSFLKIQVSVMLRPVEMFQKSLLTNLWIRRQCASPKRR